MGLMASFERGMERFLVPVAIKLNSQKHVAAVRDGFVFTFPIIMASSLIARRFYCRITASEQHFPQP